MALCRCRSLRRGFEPRLVQDFQRNLMFPPSQSWDIVSRVPGGTEMTMAAGLHALRGVETIHK